MQTRPRVSNLSLLTPVSAEPSSRFAHFKLCLSKHTLVLRLKPMTSTERERLQCHCYSNDSGFPPPTAAASLSRSRTSADVHISTIRRRVHMQSEARRHKSCTHVHELSHFLFPSIQSADITNGPRVRLLLNWEVGSGRCDLLRQSHHR